MRKQILLNDNWYLLRDGREKAVSLPHCFNENDGQGEGKMFRGELLYKKIIKLDENDLKNEIYLQLDGASNMSRLYINDEFVGSSNCGFSMKRYQIDSKLHLGENEIKIYVSNLSNQKIYPTMADFSFYGGLYRGVSLIMTSGPHFDLLDGSRDGFDANTYLSDNKGVVEINARIKMQDESNLTLLATIMDKDGKEITKKKLKASYNNSLSLDVLAPHLWSGIEDPYLYRLKLSLYGDELFDEKEIKIGFRSLSYDENGLYLNGKPYMLRGVGKHQDYAKKGNAISISDIENDLDIILRMGVNSIRATHYQHADDFYSLCDEKGILVWAEIPVISAINQSEEANLNAKEQLTYLISQVRNHTCVYCYGVQNEVCMVTKNEYSFKLVRELASLAKELDPSRFTAQANEYTTENDCIINSYTDIIGYNLYYGWYYGNMEELGPRLDAIHEANPSKLLILTEYGVDTNPQIHSSMPKRNDYSEEYQLLYSKNALDTIKSRPWLGGSYAWVMFDFGSSMRDEGGKMGQNQKGLVTIDRKIFKDAYYLYQACWSKGKFIHIAGKRYINRAEELTNIYILSNLKNIVLNLNGLSYKAFSDAGIATFRVPLRVGENKITAYAFENPEFKDTILINRVLKADKSYVIEKKEERSTAVNWFENVDVENIVGMNKPLRPEGYTIDDRICDIFSSKKAKEIFMKYFAFLTESSRFDETSPLTLKKILDFAHVSIPDNVKNKINHEFNMVDK